MHDVRKVTEQDKFQLKVDLLSDLFLFTRVMFEMKHGRPFLVSKPDGNESHFATICRELTDVFLGKSNRLLINCPPGWSKTEICKNFIAWCLARYPISKFLYISHSFDLASLHTGSIKQIITLPSYQELFNVHIRRDSSAKDFFQTTEGGAVVAFGSTGGITGHDAGLPGVEHFSGAIIIDDIHKPEDIHSDTIRDRVKRNYFETIERRLRAPNIPIIIIGQRLHEDDLPAHLLSGADGREWRKVIIKAIDEAGNARYPEVNPREQLLLMKEKQPYVFASQYQQNPIPAGGGLFQKSWFPLLDKMPKILATFVTADTAETEKEYNDATVFSFWGIYQLEFNGRLTNEYAIHWLNCEEIRIEPKDLEGYFLDFWARSMEFGIKPTLAAIEKKSTGVTLLSALRGIPGLRVIDVNRSGKSTSKTNRFIEMQKYIASAQVTLPLHGKHTTMCIDHMSKITANNTHRWDDIADTCYDAIKMALIDRTIISKEIQATNYDEISKKVTGLTNKREHLRKSAFRA